MASVLPHSDKIRSDCATYLTDCAKAVSEHCSSLTRKGSFQHIYKIALGADTVLSKLSSSERPRLSAARIIVRRIPILIAAAQLGAARIELRRLIEVSFLTLYFTDHCVEWNAYQQVPNAPVSRETHLPISMNAHREPSFYSNYAKELFEDEKSGLARRAAGALAVQYGNLSAFIHARSSAVEGGLLTWSAIRDSELDGVGKLFRACAFRKL